MITCHDLMSGYSGAIRSNVRFTSPSVSFMMLAFVAQASDCRPSDRANSNAVRMIFSEPLALMSLRHWATSGVCMCSMPA